MQNPAGAIALNSNPRRLWLFCICAGMLVYFTQVTAFFPVLPLYITQHWSKESVGFVVGAMAAGLLCFRPVIGWLIDRWGRKPVLCLGLFILLAILPLYVWCPTPGWLMGVRVLHGISQAAFATAAQTMMADLVPPPRRAAMLGYLAMANTIGFSLGPLFGSLMFAQAGFSAVILGLAVLTILGFGLTIPLPWHSAPSVETTTSTERSFPWKIILQFPVRDATSLFVPNSAVFYSLNAMVAVLVRFGLGKWGDRVSQGWVVSGAILCSGLALVGLAIAPQFLVLWSILYGLGFGSLFPVLSAIVSLASPVVVRGRVFSFFLAGFDSGMTLAGAGLQPLLQILPLSGVFLMLGGIGCSVSLFALRQFSRHQCS
jgi:MFS family permease